MYISGLVFSKHSWLKCLQFNKFIMSLPGYLIEQSFPGRFYTCTSFSGEENKEECISLDFSRLVLINAKDFYEMRYLTTFCEEIR